MTSPTKAKKIQKICTDRKTAVRIFGDESADGVAKCIKTLENFPFRVILNNRLCDFHALIGDRQGQYAMKVSKKNRLITVIIDEKLESVSVEDIIDYHH